MLAKRWIEANTILCYMEDARRMVVVVVVVVVVRDTPPIQVQLYVAWW
jgi:hypothetical protein